MTDESHSLTAAAAICSVLSLAACGSSNSPTHATTNTSAALARDSSTNSSAAARPARAPQPRTAPHAGWSPPARSAPPPARRWDRCHAGTICSYSATADPEHGRLRPAVHRRAEHGPSQGDRTWQPTPARTVRRPVLDRRRNHVRTEEKPRLHHLDTLADTHQAKRTEGDAHPGQDRRRPALTAPIPTTPLTREPDTLRRRPVTRPARGTPTRARDRGREVPASRSAYGERNDLVRGIAGAPGRRRKPFRN